MIAVHQTVDASMMRGINRAAVLDLIRWHSPISRSEIAERLEVSLPTAIRIVDELLADDLVRYEGNAPSTGGRPRPLVVFNGAAYAVIGVDLGGARTFASIADLSGHIQHEIELPRTDGDAERNLEDLCGVIAHLLDTQRPAGQRIRGVGVGVPGITHAPEGVVTFAPSLGWRDVPLQAILRDRFSLPIFVENDVNLAALGECGFGSCRGARNLVCLTLGTGVGAGLILDGALYRGHHQGAGEVGYLLPGVEFLGRAPNPFGVLEDLCSANGIARRGAAARAAQGLPLHADQLTSQDVFSAARRGECWASGVIEETVGYLSLTIGNLATTLDPEVIVLGGDIAAGADLILEPILSQIRPALLFTPNIVASALGRRSTAMGAIMLVLSATTESLVLKRLH